MSNSSAKNKKSKEKAKKAITRQAMIDGLKTKLPKHVKLITYDTPEWEQIKRSNSEAWEKGRGMVQTLWSGGPINRHETFEGKTGEEIRDEIMSIVDFPEMADVEEKFYHKFGDYAKLPYTEWAEKVHALFPESVNFEPDETCLLEAVRHVTDLIREGLQNIGCEELVRYSAKDAFSLASKGKNSGWPFFSKKWSKKDGDEYVNEEMVKYYIEQATSLLNGVDVLKDTPYILFCRSQANGFNTAKMRPVEAPTKAEAIAAKAYTEYLVRAFQTIPQFYGMKGGEKVHEVMDDFRSYKYWVEGDFSSFDNTCGPLMPYVFNILKELSNHENDAYFDIVYKFYSEARVITPLGLISSDKGCGLMSGSGWTSVIGTIVNSISVRYVMNRMGIQDYKNLAYGDDIALACNEFDIEAFERYMFELNLICNKSKQCVTEGAQARVSFLGYYHFKDKPENTGVFPIMRLAPGLVYREKWAALDEMCQELDEDEEDFSSHSKIGIDLLGFAKKLDNARNHPNFEKLVTLFKENEPNKMNTELIMPFERLQQALRCGRTGKETSLMNSKIMQLLYEQQWGDELRHTERVEYKPFTKVTPSGVIEVRIEKHTTYVVDGVSNHEKITVYSRTEDINKIPYEQVVAKLMSKLEGFKGGANKAPKEKPTKLILNSKVELKREYVVEKVKNGTKTKVDLMLFSGTNGVFMKLFTAVAVSEENAKSVVDELAEQFEIRMEKSYDLKLKATIHPKSSESSVYDEEEIYAMMG